MSTAGKNTRRVAPKKVKDDLNLKIVAKPNTTLSSPKGSQGAKSPNVPKEILLTFYDKLLNKQAAGDMPAKSEEVVASIPEAGIRAKGRQRRPCRACKTSGDLPIPCTSDLCSKVRQLVQMNNQVERFKKKFLEINPPVMDEKRALQQKKFEIGNEYSRRNAKTSRKCVPRMDKNKNALNEGYDVCRDTEKVKWGADDVITCEDLEDDVERRGENDYLLALQGSFVDCLEDDLPSSPDSFSKSFLAAIRTEKPYDTDYTSCTDTTREKDCSQSPRELVRKSSSAKMLIHFKELLSMHILPKNANDVKCSILCDEDVAFLKNLVEADERYRYLKQEDHKLLKEILQTQLIQIETQERILAETLKKLRQKTGSSEAVTIITRNQSKEEAEQPLEMSPKEIAAEAVLHNNSEGLEISKSSTLVIDLADDRSIDQVDKTCNLPENVSSKQESVGTSSFKSALNECIALDGLEYDWSYPSKFESDHLLSKIHLDLATPPILSSNDNIPESRPSTPCESERSSALRYGEEDSLEGSTPKKSCEEKNLIPLLNIDQFENGCIKEFFTKSLKRYSETEIEQDGNNPQLHMEDGFRNTSTPPDQIHLFKAATVSLEKFVENLENEVRSPLSERNEINHNGQTVKLDANNSSPKNILGTPRSCQNYVDDTVNLDDSDIDFDTLASERIQYKVINDSAKAVTKKATPNKLSKTVQTLERVEENSGMLEVKSKNLLMNQFMECVDIEGTAETFEKSPREKIYKTTGEHLQDTTKRFVDKASSAISISCFTGKIEKSPEDQHENVTPITYLTTLFEHTIFWEHLATVEVRPLCISRQRCIVKEFKMMYLPVEDMKHAGEFYILHSENSKIKIEKTNFEKLHQQPEKLTKLLQPMYKKAVDKAISTNDHEYKYFYPCQISDYPVPEDIMVQNVICCLFKTFATNPELYKKAILNCESLPNALPQLLSKENRTPGEHNFTIAIGENKQQSASVDRTDFYEVQQQETFLEIPAKNNNESLPRSVTDAENLDDLLIKYPEGYEPPSARRIKIKNLLVFGAQILLFTVLVVGLSMYEYSCLEL